VFPSSNVGYAIGHGNTNVSYSSILLKTLDGGETWTSISSGEFVTANIIDISCISETTFYIIYNNSLKKSVNGGQTFESITSPVNQFANSMQFLNDQVGYIVQNNSLYKTNNGGISWFTLANDSYIKSIFFINENIGFIYGNGNFKTIDGGLNMSFIGYSGSTLIHSFSLNENVIWEVNGYYALCGCPPTYCVAKRSVTDVPENQLIENCNLGDGYDLIFNSIHFANETKGFAVGIKSYTGQFGLSEFIGAIYKNSTGIMLPADTQGVNDFNKKDAIRIYPNPAKDQITLTFTETPNPFEVSITDGLGKTVFSQTYSAQNNVNIATAAFSKGIYFLTVSNQDKKQTQKLIID
jgi:hypothetical protein